MGHEARGGGGGGGHVAGGGGRAESLTQPTRPRAKVTALNLLGQPRTTTFHLDEARAVDSIHPLTSFEARGRQFYVDADHFEDKTLLARLAPEAAAAHAVEGAEAQLAASEAERRRQQLEQPSQQ